MATQLTCERCGRLLNRVTGRCPVCDQYGGAPPPPTKLPPEPESQPPMAAAPPARPVAPPVAPAPPPPVRPSPPPPSVPSHPAPLPAAAVPPTVSRKPVGAFGGARKGRRRLEVFGFENAVVLAKAGSGDDNVNRRAALTPGQLQALDPENELIDGDRVLAVDIWERWPGGQATIYLNDGGHRGFTWTKRAAKGVDPEDVFAAAFPGKVDLVHLSQTRRLVRIGGAVLLAIGLVVAAVVGIGILLKPSPPPPPPKAPPTTLSAAQQQVRAALGPACPGWRKFSGAQTRGVRPDQASLKSAAGAMAGPMHTAAGADSKLALTDQQVGYLVGLAGQSPDVVAKEPVARIFYAMDLVDTACTGAGA